MPGEIVKKRKSQGNQSTKTPSDKGGYAPSKTKAKKKINDYEMLFFFLFFNF